MCIYMYVGMVAGELGGLLSIGDKGHGKDIPH